jgi:hypothetical protein
MLNLKKHMMMKFFLLFGFILAGCNTMPTQAENNVNQESSIGFIDLAAFDQKLGRSLSANLIEVSVTFDEPISPNKIPDRLQPWMSEVDSGGGQIKVIQPPGELQPKFIIPIFSLLPSLWEGIQYVRKKSLEPKFNAAKKYDAELILKKNAGGQNVIEKIIFKRKS